VPSAGTVRFAFLGGAHPWKGGGVLARALQGIPHEHLRVHVHGVAAADWESFGAGPAPRCVQLHPEFKPDALSHVLANADVVLIPSLMLESFSLVAREALQHGLPVIVSDSGGPLEVIRPDENGLVVPRGDAEALGAAMRRFVEDAPFRARATAAAAATPVRSIADQAEQVESIYADVVRGNGPRASAPPARALPRAVLVLSGIEGAPHRYRVTHLLEQLALLGVRAESYHFHDRRALTHAADAEIVVLYRVPWDAYVEATVERVRSAGGFPLFAVDDLIFDPSMRSFPNLAGLRGEEVSAWYDGLRLYRATLDACDAFLGSTEALSRAADALGKRAFIHRNTLSFELLELSESARRVAVARPPERVRLGYFSGTRTHQHDFDAIGAPLARVLSRHPEATLVLAGYVRLPAPLEPLEDRIERIPFMQWRELPRHLAGVDVNLVPLASSVFNDAKSELKYFEAAAAGVVTVASPTEPFRRAIRHGETGLLAEDETEWDRALERLIASPDERRRFARAARQDAYLRYGPWTAAQELAETLRALEALRGGAPLRRLAPVPEETFAAFVERGLGVGEAALEPPDAIPGPCQLGHTRPSVRIRGEATVSQRFRCPKGFLFRLDVMVGTHHGLNIHDVVLTLRDARTGAELARASRDASLAVDNAWLAFELPDVDAAGRELVATFEALSAAADEGLSIWGEPQAEGSGARGDSLCFRTWLRPEGWVPELPLDVGALAPEEAVAKLAAALRRERERTDALEARLRRTDQRLALALRPARADALSWARTTIPYRAARKAYRLVRGVYRSVDRWLRSR
jgi:glycosyltransferase involved in cell wall biosynthesis